MSEAVPARDVLLYGLSQSIDAARLAAWAQETMPAVVPDFHRCQLEWWVWSHRATVGPRVLDIGVYDRRAYFGPGYRTMGQNGEDVRGDVCAMPFEAGSWDAVVLTEVLEHCLDPWAAMREVHRVLVPGGTVLVTSPFLWPWHGCEDYEDYWRFTHQGWERLLAAFEGVRIIPCALTPEGAAGYEQLRRWECMGWAQQTHITTGYLCSATKPLPA